MKQWWPNFSDAYMYQPALIRHWSSIQWNHLSWDFLMMSWYGNDFFLHYWSFVRGICWSPLGSLINYQQSFDFSIVSLNKLLNKELGCKWFEMSWRSCSFIVMSIQIQEEELRFLSCELDSSPPGQNGRHFADNILIRIFLNENV